MSTNTTIQSKPRTVLDFELASSDSSQFGPRTGRATLTRPDDHCKIVVETPGLMTATSRGVVPHLSYDHHRQTDAIRWVNLHFESFLERTPSLPTLLDVPRPLHTLLGFLPDRNIISLSLRDPADGREMPPNGNDTVMAHCVRGVRKVSPMNWRAHILASNPDVVHALSDTPFTTPPYSQKRLAKSLERSLSWLSNLLRPIDGTHPLNVLVHMPGNASAPARAAFADGLLERPYGPEAAAIAPLPTLDAGVAGYVFDLVPLHAALYASTELDNSSSQTPPKRKQAPPAARAHLLDPAPPSVPTSALAPLLHASLAPLPSTKLRIVQSLGSPHEALRLISAVGIDLFDGHWAQRAADVGVALDFSFPAPVSAPDSADVGHNLYETRYARDFAPLADAFRAGAEAEGNEVPTCPCFACSPRPAVYALSHSSVDPSPPTGHRPCDLPFTRAYVHHLLHTHEMSAHAFLAAHNLAVMDTFFGGIRRALRETPGTFSEEVTRFERVYDPTVGVIERARLDWLEVERARGRGRLTREREKQDDATLGTAIEL